MKRTLAIRTAGEVIPVYTPKDYPLIRQLPGTDDMPLTWEEWCSHFDTWQLEQLSEHQLVYRKVRVRPDLFKTWLEANSLSASEPSRNLYAQQLFEARKARRKADDEQEADRQTAAKMAANTPPPNYPPWVKVVVYFIRSLISFRTGAR